MGRGTAVPPHARSTWATVDRAQRKRGNGSGSAAAAAPGARGHYSTIIFPGLAMVVNSWKLSPAILIILQILVVVHWRLP